MLKMTKCLDCEYFDGCCDSEMCDLCENGEMFSAVPEDERLDAMTKTIIEHEG